MGSSTYESDYYAWTQTQVHLLQAHLQDKPSLQGRIPEALLRAYPLAVIGAERETGLESFPGECSFTIEQILAADFFPA
jgi:hypothetical protein